MAQIPLVINPSPLNFGYVSVDGTNHRDIELINIGSHTLEMDSCQFQPPFYIDSIAGITIEPHGSATISTNFRPEQETDYSCCLAFYYNHQLDTVYNLNINAYGIRAFDPGEIIWSFQHIDNVVCVTAAGDYNNDGFPDVVAEGYYYGAEGNPLVCLSGSGCEATDTIWSVQPEGGHSDAGGFGDQCLAYVDDLNGDGHGDIVRGGAWNCRTVFAVDGLNGSTLWTYDTYQHPESGWIYSVTQTGDMNDDGICEILACAGSDANRAYCLDGATGELIWRYRADDGVAAIISLDDVDDDGYDDAVFASRDNGRHIYCISGRSEEDVSSIWIYNIHEDTYSLSSIADINNDGYRDVIAGTWGSGLTALSGHSDDTTGTMIWQYPMNNYIMRAVACPDLDGDGIEDVLVASWTNLALAISGVDGSEIWRHECGDEVWAIDFVDDVTGDSIIDVIAGAFDSKVYLINGATGNQAWQCDVNNILFTVRGIGDVNGDGYADVIAGTKRYNDSGGEVFLISGGPPEPIYVPDHEQQAAIPKDYIVTSNYPNPFNSATIIKFNLDSDLDYTLSIYDITGRLVERINNRGQAGTNIVRWNLADRDEIVSGVYFYKLDAGVKAGVGRMLFLK